MDRIEEYLNQIPMWAVKKNSLKDIRSYLEELGNPDQSMKIIHVAGTNGKGSVCSFLTSALVEAGYRTGTFVSPHLEDTRERFLLNGVMTGSDLYEEAFETVKSLADRMIKKGRKPPAYFEFLFYMFMVINARFQPDYVILETGLGGRLDVTNVIEEPVLVVITSISLDHMEYLGDTIEKIAGEKAGIIKSGIPVVYDDNQPAASVVIRARAEELKCPVVPVSREHYRLLGREEEYTSIAVNEAEGERMILRVPSVAEYQLMNAAVAETALRVLKKTGSCGITKEELAAGIQKSFWPGRMEQVLPGVYLDGAHNAGGMEALVETAAWLQKESGKPVHLLFSAVSDKEYQKMIRQWCQQLSLKSVLAVHMTSERGLDPDVLVREFCKELTCPVTGFSTAEEAFEHLLHVKQEDELAFCAGSLYLIGELKQILRRREYD